MPFLIPLLAQIAPEVAAVIGVLSSAWAIIKAWHHLRRVFAAR